MNFWKESKDPFFILAPMEDVTDTVFREVVMSISDADVLNIVFTEFTSVDGLLDSRGFKNVSQRLIINESEKELLNNRGTKLVAQIWGNDPEKFFKAAKLITENYDFDGIDINMGCPVKNVVKKATCSALIKYPDLAKEIILATKEGTKLPVSVKTRIGFNAIVTEPWLSQILETQPAALTIHGRTQKQLSNGLADWNEIEKAVYLRNAQSPETKIIGNGDIDSYQKGLEKINTHNLNGVMVGRGVFTNPWMFTKHDKAISIEERMNLLHKHINIFEKTWGTNKNPNILKRFFKIYLNGFRGANILRAELMNCSSYEDFYKVLNHHTIIA